MPPVILLSINGHPILSEWLTFIPSLGRKKIIPDFAERLGKN